MTLETEFLGTWRIAPKGFAKELMRRAGDSSWPLSAETPIEVNAFGCDSKVFTRAISRVLQKAADQAFDLVEIMEIERHEDSGLDYVSILARALRMQGNSTANLVEVDGGSTVR